MEASGCGSSKTCVQYLQPAFVDSAYSHYALRWPCFFDIAVAANLEPRVCKGGPMSSK
jgi:hypothetical protein